MGELKNRVALITGASRGIGRAIASRFAAEGAAVVLSASRIGEHGGRQGTLEEAVAEINGAGGQAAAVVANLSDEAARSDLIERASEPFGPIDVLVNNAAGARMRLPSESTSEERRFMFELNVNAPVDLAQQALPAMRAQGAGWILNLTGGAAHQSRVPYRDTLQAALIVGPYGATKAALERYTEALAHELSPDGIFVNALAPVAIVLTQSAEYVRDIAQRNPDMVEPVETMAEAALELCTGRHVGQIVCSRELLHSTARNVRSLDSLQVLGDAQLQTGLEAIA
jgi:NAD(P)-dependent dehydrogenase (short-subunit alcohol dehydrogenase family)